MSPPLLTCPALPCAVARPASSCLASPLLDRLRSPTYLLQATWDNWTLSAPHRPSQKESHIASRASQPIKPIPKPGPSCCAQSCSCPAVGSAAAQRSVPHSTAPHNPVEASSPKTFISAVIRATARDKEKPPSCRHSACVVLPPNHHNKPLPLPRSSPHLKEWWSQQSSPYSTAVPFNTLLLHPVPRCPTLSVPHCPPMTAHVPGAGRAAAQCSALCCSPS